MSPKLHTLALASALLTSQPALSQGTDKVNITLEPNHTTQIQNTQTESKSRADRLLAECDMNNDGRISDRKESKKNSLVSKGIAKEEYKCKLRFDSKELDKKNEELDYKLEILVDKLGQLNKDIADGNGIESEIIKERVRINEEIQMLQINN